MLVLFFTGSAYASTNNNTGNSGENNNNTEEEKKEELKENNPENQNLDPVVKAIPEEADSDALKKSQDSTNINSLSKFNFVFYFIYKLKYNEEPVGNEYQF